MPYGSNIATFANQFLPMQRAAGGAQQRPGRLRFVYPASLCRCARSQKPNAITMTAASPNQVMAYCR
jgi:hypothetical protein